MAKGLKTGGRMRGTPNKNGQDLLIVLNAANVNVAEKLMKLLPKLKAEKQADVLMKLMEYIYPKRKSVETKREPEGYPDWFSLMKSIDFDKYENNEKIKGN